VRHRFPWGVAAAAGILIAAVVLVGVVVVSGGGHEQVTYRYVIPAGTGDRITAGEEVEIVPARLEVRVGDRLLLRNKDDVQHHMGPLQVDPNGLMSLTFSDEGTIRGLCTLNQEGTAAIVVRK
jgi:hypothetical protein